MVVIVESVITIFKHFQCLDELLLKLIICKSLSIFIGKLPRPFFVPVTVILIFKVFKTLLRILFIWRSVKCWIVEIILFVVVNRSIKVWGIGGCIIEGTLVIPRDKAFVYIDNWIRTQTAVWRGAFLNLNFDWNKLDFRFTRMNKFIFGALNSFNLCKCNGCLRNHIDQLIRHGLDQLVSRYFHELSCNGIKSFRDFFSNQ